MYVEFVSPGTNHQVGGRAAATKCRPAAFRVLGNSVGKAASCNLTTPDVSMEKPTIVRLVSSYRDGVAAAAPSATGGLAIAEVAVRNALMSKPLASAAASD